MEKIKTTNTQYSSQSSEVLISLREPFNKRSIWIHPHKDYIEVKVFNKEWEVLSTTKDTGLSSLSSKQINELIENLKQEQDNKIIKQVTKFDMDSAVLLKKQKELEQEIFELNKKIDKLITKYNNLSNAQ